jgi:hypothetical protein
LNFKLAAQGDQIALYDPNAQLVDQVSFGSQVEGVSQGRLPDGSATIVCFPGTASPAAPNYVTALDSDGDGLPDYWELTYGLNPYSAIGDDGANGDPDHDGFTNLQEYLAGTNPRDPQSCLKLEAITTISGSVTLSFLAVPNHTYTIQYQDNLSGAPWLKLADFPAEAANLFISTNDAPAPTHFQRFYRLVTPRMP